MRRLILVDGTCVLYRAFYAIADLKTSGGVPTNAVFGFIRMLGQLRDTWTPSHWIVTFDGGLPEERKKLLAEYKAQRRPMPDTLRGQLPLVERYLDAARVAWMRVAGQEADDVIASLAHQAGPEAEVMVATSDKDILQLVSDRLNVVPVAGKGAVLDPAGVRMKTGVDPRQIVDWLAMVGDTSDNIPGLPGIGPKTAARLLGRYGSIDSILAALPTMADGRERKALEGNVDILRRNVQMVRLRTDLDVSLSWDVAAVQPPNREALVALLGELEFHSMARAVGESLF